MLKAKYVSVGFSAGAIGMIEAIRKYDKKGKILCITKEKYPAYGRPAIVDYAMHKIDDEGIFYKGSGYSAMRNVDTVLGTAVSGIDASSHTLILQNGEQVSYEKLLINTGGKPISPPLPGKELEGVTHFFNLDEAKEMRRLVKEKGCRKAVVIGGGLIGLKATEALCHLGVKVTMVELMPMILSRALDGVSSAMMTEKLRKAGVEVITGTSVKEIIGDKTVRKVKLDNGQEIETDLVYMAIGVTPDTELAEKSGIKANKGIDLDRRMLTSQKDIFAAGDAAKGYNFLTNNDMIIAIWPVARKMGYFAGLNMMDMDREYDGSIPMNSLYFEDLYTISYGDSNPQDTKGYEILEKRYTDGKSYRKIVIRDDRVVGAVFVNDISRAGIVKGLMYECVPASKYKDQILKKDFSFVHVPKDYRDQTYTVPFINLEVPKECKA